MTIDSPTAPPAENGAMLAGTVAFVVVAAMITALVTPALDQLFLGYTPHHLATAIGIAAGAIAARLGYRRVRVSA